MVYTVDEVSVKLGIPRPTVYRYLKEYSIPFTRRSGRIFVYEESVGKVRTVRELHDGGFGTEAVRVKLRQGDGPDLTSVVERLDKLTAVVEGSKREPGRTVEPARASADAHALRMVLARQTLLISAVSNLAEMVGDLMATNGLPRRPVLDYPRAEHDRLHPALPERDFGSSLALASRNAPARTVGEPLARRPHALPSGTSPDKFGTLARRRRVVLASLTVALALLAVLTWQIL